MCIDAKEVTGLVLHFRTPASTLACLRSMVSEGIRGVVLVDNSEDGGQSLVSMRVELERLRASGVAIDVLAPSRNLGFAKGMNAGWVRVRDRNARAVLLINSDAYIEQGGLSALLRCVENAAVVAPRTRTQAGAPDTSLFRFYQRASALNVSMPWPGCIRYVSGCCLLMRSDEIDRSLFDEEFFFYGEDVMLSDTLRGRGVQPVECSEAVIVHAGSGSAKNGSLFYEYHINRGHWLLACKLARNEFERVAFVCIRCVTLPLRATARSVRFRSLAPWRALCVATLDVLRGRCRSFTPPAAHHP